MVKQPVPSMYVITELPAAVPVTIPIVGLTVATDGLLLFHTPPDTASLKVAEAPAHMVAAPLIVAGFGLTVRAVAA